MRISTDVRAILGLMAALGACAPASPPVEPGSTGPLSWIRGLTLDQVAEAFGPPIPGADELGCVTYPTPVASRENFLHLWHDDRVISGAYIDDKPDCGFYEPEILEPI